MSTKKLNTMIKRAMLELLREHEEQKQKVNEKDQKKSSKGKKPKKSKNKIDKSNYVGGGRFKGIFDFEMTETRAMNDSSGLMRDLGVSSAAGSTDLDMANSVLKQAISNNDVMSDAFSSPKITENKETGKKRIVIDFNNPLDYRAAAKYIYLTLLGAENAGILRSMKKGIKFLSRSEVSVPTIEEIL